MYKEKCTNHQKENKCCLAYTALSFTDLEGVQFLGNLSKLNYNYTMYLSPIPIDLSQRQKIYHWFYYYGVVEI